MSKRFEERVHPHKKDERVANKHINRDSTWLYLHTQIKGQLHRSCIQSSLWQWD